MAQPLPVYEYDEQQVITREEWRLEDSELHRVDGPARREWETGVLTLEEWRLAGQRHRVDGPAVREWTVADGQPVLTFESWWLQGKAHRVDGPAKQMWEIVNGQPVLVYATWWLKGELHRVDGPAEREWEIIDGLPVVVYEAWYLNYNRIPSSLLPTTALTLQRWYRRYHAKRWSFIASHLSSTSLIVFPGLIPLLQSY